MKKIKRILAVMLCLCMAMSILPVGASAAAADSVSVDFTSEVTADFETSATYGFEVKGTTNGYASVEMPESDWFAYDIGTLQEGYYDGIISFVPFWNSCEFNFYIVPKGDVASVTQAVNSETPDVVVNFHDEACESASSTNTRKNLLNAYLPEDGEYYIVGKYNSGKTIDAGAYKYCYVLLTGLNMKRIGGAADFSNKASIDFTDGAIPSIKSGSAHAPTFVVDDELTPDVDERHNYFRFSGGEFYQYNAFDIGNIEAGDYKGTINYAKVNDANLPGGIFDIYLLPINQLTTSVANAIIYALNPNAQESVNWEEDEPIKIATVDCSTDSENSYWQNCTFTANDLKAGKYYLVVTQASTDKTYVRLQGFDMVPADFEYATAGDEADEAGKALFGDNYAYIRKDGADWVVNFFGGVKETKGYTKVGFKVTYNDDQTKEQGNEKVYSSLNIGGQNIAASEFGADVKFIFSEEITLSDIDASKGIEFVAYAIDENDNYVYGNTYTAVIE